MRSETFINTTAIDKIPQVKQFKDPKSAVNEMNGFFISHFFKLMYNTVDSMQTDTAFGGSSGEKIFREFLINEYGNVMSEKFNLTSDMLEKYVVSQDTALKTQVDA